MKEKGSDPFFPPDAAGIVRFGRNKSLSGTDAFFQRPILNSPYAYPSRHWELDASGQPTQRIQEGHKILYHALCEWVDERVD